MTTTRDLFTMRILPFVLAIAATGLLAACEPRGTHSPGDLTKSELNTGRGMVATDPARRQDLLNNCRARIQMKPERQRNNMAALMGVSPAQVPTVFCERIISAIESGRLAAADLNAGGRGEFSPKVIAVVQGR